WAPDGRRVAYGKLYTVPFEYIIESRDLKSEHVATVVSDSKLQGLNCWLPDGRIIYGSGQSGELNLWEIRTHIETGEPTGRPRRITDWTGSGNPGVPSVSADGKRLAVMKGS